MQNYRETVRRTPALGHMPDAHPLHDTVLRFASYDVVHSGQRYNTALRATARCQALRIIIAADGILVAEFTDHTRKGAPWADGLAGRTLLEALDREPDEREFDAVMVPCPWASLYGDNLDNTLTLFEHFGVSLWTPETAGSIGADNLIHLRLLAEITCAATE